MKVAVMASLLAKGDMDVDTAHFNYQLPITNYQLPITN